MDKIIGVLVANNFQHHAGDGMATRQRTLKQIVPALTKPCGSSGCPYILIDSDDAGEDKDERSATNRKYSG